MDKNLVISLGLALTWLAAPGENVPIHLDDNISCGPCYCYVSPGKGITADCSNQSLETIPATLPRSVTYLRLQNNVINDVYPHLGGFKKMTFLDLSSNKIKTLPVDTFVNNTKLETLRLRDNYIELNYAAYPKGLFRKQKNMVNLDVSKNSIVESITSYPDETFGDLVSLQALTIDGLVNAVFGKGFFNLKHLRNLTLSGHRGHCRIENVSSKALIHLPNLRFLDVSKCFLLDIDKSAFQPLRKIDTLIISANRVLGIDNFGQSLYGLQNSSVRFIDASKIVSMYAIGVEVRVEHISYLNNTKLKHLKFDYNRLELIHNMVPLYLSHLESLSIEGNRFIFGGYIVFLDPMKNLKEIFASNQFASEAIFGSREISHVNLKMSNDFDRTNHDQLLNNRERGDVPRHSQDSLTDTEIRHHIQPQKRHIESADKLANQVHLLSSQEEENRNMKKKHYSLPFRIPVPPHMTYINASGCQFAYDISPLNFYDNVIRILDLSSNVFTKWYGPISPVDHLELLDISNNYCDNISSEFFDSVFNLLILNIYKNYLSVSLSNDTSGQIFKNLSKLVTIRMTHNSITYLPSLIFKGLESLEYLDLSWNILSTWTPEIRHMKKLKEFDLSVNRFEEIPKKLRNDIDVITKDGHHVHLHVRGNALKCNCRSLEYLQWMMNSNAIFTDLDETSCQLENGTSISLQNLNEIVMQLHLYCKAIVPLIMGVVSGFLIFVAIIVAGFVYRYRWKLRYLYYTTRRKYKGYQKLTEDEDDYTYDAFVSYADEDRHFVVDDMRNMLEKNFGLRLCIHHRDFMVGQVITDNIINAIQASRRTVVILSPNFLKSSWCKYEVHMARFEGIYTGRDVLCVVWYADVHDNREIPNDLLEEIATGTYLKYTEDEEGKVLFWQSLKAAITN